jgi:hypothetical protein
MWTYDERRVVESVTTLRRSAVGADLEACWDDGISRYSTWCEHEGYGELGCWNEKSDELQVDAAHRRLVVWQTRG